MTHAPIRDLSRIRRSPGRTFTAVAISVALAVAVLSASMSSAVTPPGYPASRHLAAGTSNPPPPSPKLFPYLSQFWPILAAYHAAALDDGPIPFALWLIVNGVTDPVEHHAMVALYAWWMESTRRLRSVG
ncbi:MAG TPA: hypothetical protein PKC43_14325 [Phycisphaerales bacterium]|nr:hypothetical protein [Phycisphaerales bacterium]HMP38610.1 hypothetical protein [Phycisphaerales bacterium]